MSNPSERGDFFPALRDYLEQRKAEFDQIPVERQDLLAGFAKSIRACLDAKQPVRLTFICTHNSRRSHMSQIWAATAAEAYNISGVETYSGGTETTAFNPRAVAALIRAGFKIEIADELNPKNPQYAVRFRDAGTPMICFSKVYHDAPNPKQDFCAVMTCSQADMDCPIVQGSRLRVSVSYIDPKVSDDTPAESATYDERCQQICREMMYLFSRAQRTP